MARAKYEKIADSLKRDIERGFLVPGSRLPKIADLAGKFDVSYVTMANAVQLLSSEGYVRAIQGNGIFVNVLPEAIDKQDINWLAPIEGDLYGRCFRTAQDIFDEADCRLIPVMPPDRLRDIALENPERAEKILKEYCTKPLIIEGTRHFPFSLLKKVNPTGKNVYFLIHAECDRNNFPESLTVTPDFCQAGLLAAQKLHKLGAERLFVLSYENISAKEMKLADEPPFTYEKYIIDSMNEYAAANNLPEVEVFRTYDNYINDFEKLEPFFNTQCGFMAIGDQRAHTLYRYARRNNIEIGRQWHVIGMGRTDWWDVMEPHLESISLEEITLVRKLASEILMNNHSKYILCQTKL